MTRTLRAISAVSAIVAIVVLAGCSDGTTSAPDRSSAAPSQTASGSTSAPPAATVPSRCPPALRTVFARAARTGTVAMHGDASADYLACQLRDRHAAAGTCSGAKVTINDQSQAYVDFQRWVVESGQTAGQSGNPDLAPVRTKAGIGIDSDWIAGTLNFEAASSDRWVAVFLTCPAPNARELPLAEDLARIAMNS